MDSPNPMVLKSPICPNQYLFVASCVLKRNELVYDWLRPTFLCCFFSFTKKRKSLATKNCNLQFSWGLITATYTFWISCKHADNLTWQHNYTFCGVLAAKLLFFEKFFRETHRNGGTLACTLCCQGRKKVWRYAGASSKSRPLKGNFCLYSWQDMVGRLPPRPFLIPTALIVVKQTNKVFPED